jgi:hypothetical protein
MLYTPNLHNWNSIIEGTAKQKDKQAVDAAH